MHSRRVGSEAKSHYRLNAEHEAPFFQGVVRVKVGVTANWAPSLSLSGFLVTAASGEPLRDGLRVVVKVVVPEREMVGFIDIFEKGKTQPSATK